MPASVNAVVVGGCLLSFAQSVDLQDQQDIQDCLLYAELAANEKYPGQASRKAWFDYFQGRLLKTGYTLKTIVPAEPIRVNSVHQLLSASYRVMGSVGVERLGQLFKDTYKALRLDEFAWEFFRSNVAKGGSGILKCAPCERLASGEVIVCLLGLRYSATVIESDFFLWREFDRELAIIPDGGVFVFDRRAFENYRKRVHEKIEAYSKKVFVRKLQS
ncbi:MULTISPECIES: hypothetical protein [unclassified Pseudomonas]|jgi:hypothetical protein|uniref:hypothetical protein n=1 Tax=unclassified Pseudomonas TaxID=196821 RepID=UPI0006FC523F|nr:MULTISPECIES: hypothetical protein [unclassified Pseudomonas]KRA93680.1 hypothetical protein ASD91_07965 [Pseudomonas sp. Root68]KRB64748.1 hypothetical protein ASD95_13485 [Pseudomonas sp. Root71]